MSTRPSVARWLWVLPVVPVALYALFSPPSITWITASAAVFVVLVTMVVLRRPSGSDIEQERGLLFDLDEITVVALALVADPVLVAVVHGGTALSTPSSARYRTAYTVTMRALVGLGAALAGQAVLTATVDSEPARYLLFVGAATVAHLVLTVGSTLGVTFAIWVETGDLLDEWYAITTADAALAAMAIPLGALGADLLGRAPYGRCCSAWSWSGRRSCSPDCSPPRWRCATNSTGASSCSAAWPSSPTSSGATWSGRCTTGHCNS